MNQVDFKNHVTSDHEGQSPYEKKGVDLENSIELENHIESVHERKKL